MFISFVIIFLAVISINEMTYVGSTFNSLWSGEGHKQVNLIGWIRVIPELKAFLPNI